MPDGVCRRGYYRQSLVTETDTAFRRSIRPGRPVIPMVRVRVGPPSGMPSVKSTVRPSDETVWGKEIS